MKQPGIINDPFTQSELKIFGIKIIICDLVPKGREDCSETETQINKAPKTATLFPNLKFANWLQKPLSFHPFRAAVSFLLFPYNHNTLSGLKHLYPP